ncbi:hypothetical protein FQV37_1147 [Psychrobacter nivimaris]|uniref:Uncharacterized protein n=1 Tax=Psychrobacter nivimaris TaxID=281738 RepID=A0A6N7BYY9_9GAMM|nr:hypothetical protein FQV37_1147 [Psychrobacter nivimaris]
MQENGLSVNYTLTDTIIIADANQTARVTLPKLNEQIISAHF